MNVSKSVVSAAVVGLLYLAGSAGVPAGPRPSRAGSVSDAPQAAEPVPGGAQVGRETGGVGAMRVRSESQNRGGVGWVGHTHSRPDHDTQQRPAVSLPFHEQSAGQRPAVGGQGRRRQAH